MLSVMFWERGGEGCEAAYLTLWPAGQGDLHASVTVVMDGASCSPARWGSRSSVSPMGGHDSSCRDILLPHKQQWELHMDVETFTEGSVQDGQCGETPLLSPTII